MLVDRPVQPGRSGLDQRLRGAFPLLSPQFLRPQPDNVCL